MKLVRGQGLTQTMAEIGPELSVCNYDVEEVSPDGWYDDIVYYLLNQQAPGHLNVVQR